MAFWLEPKLLVGVLFRKFNTSTHKWLTVARVYENRVPTQQRRLGQQRIIAGQHGVATATVCARFGLQCIIYMGAQDIKRQSLNVFRMRLLGAEVRAVHSGTATLKDATSEAIRDWVTNVETTHYILGSVAGPHPYPMMVREFHAVIGKETRKQALEKWGGKPDVLVACVGGGSGVADYSCYFLFMIYNDTFLEISVYELSFCHVTFDFCLILSLKS
ncbi:hypothetical protein Q3G72_021399 [Acer saccharum]|nr:hypothetical protein Q3G72_021399 [Acer saccharum]